MPNAMFKQLTENIKNRGILESLPYCAETEQGGEIVSGHHRVRAARAANNTTIYILLDRSGLSCDQIKAKQLAHNSIGGVDDPQVLAEIYNEIKDLDARIEAFIDPKDLNIPNPEKIDIGDLDVGLNFKIITFLFLPYQLDDFHQVIDLIDGDSEMVGVAGIEQYEKLRDMIRKTKEIDDIRAIGMTLSRMSDIVIGFYQQKEERRQNEENKE